jgi:pSer/pThr/pTyr-binding forkhead associated (FHA) protein
MDHPGNSILVNCATRHQWVRNDGTVASTEIKTIGRGAACDLVLGNASVSTLHARLELADDGYLYVEDAGSRTGTWLQRCQESVRVIRTTLCVGDRISFGDEQVPLERLTSLFPARNNVRLRPGPNPKTPEPSRPVVRPGAPKTGASVARPRRDPVTGNLEKSDPEN